MSDRIRYHPLVALCCNCGADFAAGHALWEMDESSGQTFMISTSINDQVLGLLCGNCYLLTKPMPPCHICKGPTMDPVCAECKHKFDLFSILVDSAMVDSPTTLDQLRKNFWIKVGSKGHVTY